MNEINDEDVEHLYKFRSLSGASAPYVGRIFTHDELYFPRPSEFNDPFDCSPTTSLDATEEQFASYLDGLYKRRMSHLSRAERRANVKRILRDASRNHTSAMASKSLSESLAMAVESAGVFSLSARCDHILMWSHYADSHRGICLRFKATSTTPFFGRAQKVRYQVERPKLNLILDSGHVQSEKALLTKADFWSYEKEWRIIEHDLGPGIHRFPRALLDGVILGARISDSDRERVLAWIAGRAQPVEVLQARFSDDQFRLYVSSLT